MLFGNLKVGECFDQKYEKTAEFVVKGKVFNSFNFKEMKPCYFDSLCKVSINSTPRYFSNIEVGDRFMIGDDSYRKIAEIHLPECVINAIRLRDLHADYIRWNEIISL